MVENVSERNNVYDEKDALAWLGEQIEQDPDYASVIELFLQQTSTIQRLHKRGETVQTKDPFTAQYAIFKVKFEGAIRVIQMKKVSGYEMGPSGKLVYREYFIDEIDESSKTLKPVDAKMVAFLLAHRHAFVVDPYDSHSVGVPGISQSIIPVHILQSS